MKINKLIELLKEIDPTGEKEVCVGNDDIHFIQELPAYYDGNLNVLIRNESEETYYNIVGCKIVDDGTKISIETMNWRDVIENDPAAKILFENNRVKEKYYSEVRKLRKEIIELEKQFRPRPCKSCGFKSPKFDSKTGDETLSEMKIVLRMVKCRCGKHGEWSNNYKEAKDSWNKINLETNGRQD